MARFLKRIDARAVRFGGEGHSGWLPQGAAIPAPTPMKDILLNLIISSDGHGYMLEWSDRDGTHWGDAWHETLESAIEQAKLAFGVEASEWQEPTV